MKNILHSLTIILALLVLTSCNTNRDDGSLVLVDTVSQGENSELFIDFNQEALQSSVINLDCVNLNFNDGLDYKVNSLYPLLTEDYIFNIVESQNNCKILISEIDGNFLKEIGLSFVTYPSYLTYIKSKSLLVVSDNANRTLHFFNIQNETHELKEMDFNFINVHYLELQKEWVFNTISFENNRQYSTLKYFDENFNPISNLNIPFENPNILMAKASGFVEYADELYFNNWGSSTIYKVTNKESEILFKVNPEFEAASGINNFFISDSFIYILTAHQEGGEKAIYYDRELDKTFYMPIAGIHDGIEEYKFFNLGANAVHNDKLVLLLNSKLYLATESFVNNNQMQHVSANFVNPNDLLMCKYNLDSNFLISISDSEIPVYVR